MTDKTCYIALSLLYRNKLRVGLALLNHYGSAESAWAHANEPGKQAAWEQAQKELQWAGAHSVQVITPADATYPYRLLQCPDHPVVLFATGNIHPSDGHIVSIVGTRHATERGKELTTRLVRDLHDRLEQVTIVSGGAYGIDIAAHRAAIECGIPTIMIPAHGLDRIYPQCHRREAVQALRTGGLLTEYPSGTEPLAGNFLRRNRIIAGLADAVVVVESKQHGGSLATARMAVDYDRELFAFPGRPDDATSCGCNELIRSNRAHLIQNADDLIQTMGWTPRNEQHTPVQTSLTAFGEGCSESHQTILNLLGETEDGLNANLIVMETDLPYSQVSSDLLELELQGRVRALPGGIYRLVR